MFLDRLKVISVVVTYGREENGLVSVPSRKVLSENSTSESALWPREIWARVHIFAVLELLPAVWWIRRPQGGWFIIGTILVHRPWRQVPPICHRIEHISGHEEQEKGSKLRTTYLSNLLLWPSIGHDFSGRTQSALGSFFFFFSGRSRGVQGS